ncbi:hypothetical protein BS47DRAFT_1368715 [Hydnum rufescens UP504]|uniref:Uncharacterized protein n=1 Tax=Hydnum rufescens UP504 TaxID=1448309 RepID=A0A9P6DMR9_9AGAM|nr:hypothetical protein BS47DRAFT_1368715 [Hydnum rufescens UP504]
MLRGLPSSHSIIESFFKGWSEGWYNIGGSHVVISLSLVVRSISVALYMVDAKLLSDLHWATETPQYLNGLARKSHCLYDDIWFMWSYPFYIIPFGHLLCPGQNSVWSEAELGGHSTPTNFWAVVAREVYNITPFWGGNHSNIAAVPVTQTNMLELAGMELAQYFPVPLIAGCLGFVTDASLALQAENFSAQVPNTMHYSGQHTSLTEALMSEAWYLNVFPPTMKQYHKGSLSYTKDNIAKQAMMGRIGHTGIMRFLTYLITFMHCNA